MKEFRSLGSFAAHMIERELVTMLALHEGLELVATKIEETAKDEIGEYQPAVGPFPAWEPLAESTKADRVAQGYSADEPLLRSGEMRESIHHEVEALEAIIGSDSDIAFWQETGTATIPARPFLGPAAFHNIELMQKILGAATVVGLAGPSALPAGLGYDFKVTEKD